VWRPYARPLVLSGPLHGGEREGKGRGRNGKREEGQEGKRGWDQES